MGLDAGAAAGGVEMLPGCFHCAHAACLEEHWAGEGAGAGGCPECGAEAAGASPGGGAEGPGAAAAERGMGDTAGEEGAAAEEEKVQWSMNFVRAPAPKKKEG